MMKLLIYLAIFMGGCSMGVMSICLLIAGSEYDREVGMIGKENESQGEDHPEDDEEWSCGREPER